MNPSASSIRESAHRTLRLESEAIANLTTFIDGAFEQAVQRIFNGSGRVVVTGIGKSANIANKIVATLNSTGTPAVFMHAADAIHGDLGNVQKEDIVLCISKSGNSPEIKVLVPLVKSMGNLLVGMAGNLEGYLAKHSDLVLNTTVEKEACPNNLAPTTSTAAQLAMGDALAVALMEVRGFSSDDFAKYHPGGALGKRLFVRLEHLLDNETTPQVGPDTPIREVILEISGGRQGAAAVIDGSNLVGIITDGDVRRMIENHQDFLTLRARDIMGGAPKTLDAEELAVRAFELMERNSISQVLVTRDGAYAGIVHLHDILKEGIF
ncbi:MAG: KpsF/GutQ family sugar-phosphate isomerase [Flavobacteriales bacterium]